MHLSPLEKSHHSSIMNHSFLEDLKIYWNEIPKTLLNKQEEFELAQKILPGVAATHILSMIQIVRWDIGSISENDLHALKLYLSGQYPPNTAVWTLFKKQFQKNMDFTGHKDIREEIEECFRLMRNKKSDIVELEEDTRWKSEIHTEVFITWVKYDTGLPVVSELRKLMKLFLQKIGLLNRQGDSISEHEDFLQSLIKPYEQSRDTMITRNLRLVIKIAQDYASYWPFPCVDLVSEGNIGLMKAVERFDPTKWWKFSTYAAWWIKQSIKRALANQSSVIRKPVHIIDKLWKLQRGVRQFEQENGREPTDKELSDITEIPEDKIVDLRRYNYKPISLDQSMGDDPDSDDFSEHIADPNAEDAGELASKRDMRLRLPSLLDCLGERERQIIEQRFGLNGQETRTLEEVDVGKKVTRERIRQVQNIALKKLKKALKKKEEPTPMERFRGEKTGRDDEYLSDIPDTEDHLTNENETDDLWEKTLRSPVLTTDFVSKVRAQVQAMTQKSTPKTSKKIPAKKPKNNVPKEEKITQKQPAIKSLNEEQKKKLQSLILGTSTAWRSGNSITNRGRRITIMSYYLGLSGCIHQDIPEIAREMKEKEEDILATLELMAPDYLAD